MQKRISSYTEKNPLFRILALALSTLALANCQSPFTIDTAAPKTQSKSITADTLSPDILFSPRIVHDMQLTLSNEQWNTVNQINNAPIEILAALTINSSFLGKITLQIPPHKVIPQKEQYYQGPITLRTNATIGGQSTLIIQPSQTEPDTLLAQPKTGRALLSINLNNTQITLGVYEISIP